MQFNSELKRYLLSNLDLFNWEIIQDFTFFRNDYCFFDSDSSKDECWVCCDTLEAFEVLKSMGIQFVGEFYEVDKKNLHINKKHYYLIS